MRIHGVFPLIKSSLFGGLRIDLIIFTDEAVIMVENVEEITKGNDSAISPLLPGMKMIKYGLSGRARDFMEWVRELKGRELNVEEVKRLGRKTITMSYSDVASVRVNKGATITLEMEARGISRLWSETSPFSRSGSPLHLQLS